MAKKTRDTDAGVLPEIRARSIVLVDKNNNDRIVMHSSDGSDSACGIQIRGPSGLPLLDMQVSGSNEVTICFVDSDNRSAITLGVNQFGRGMSVMSGDEVAALSLGVDSQGVGPYGESQGYLMIRNTESNEQIFVPILSKNPSAGSE